MTEAYCSYDVSKLLLRKGFNAEDFTKEFFYDESVEYSTCTHQKALSWLREYKGIIILPTIRAYTSKHFYWAVCIYDNDTPAEMVEYMKGFNTYEDAVEAALKHTLENIL